MLKEQAYNEILLEQLSAEIQIVPTCKKYLVINDRLKLFVQNIDSYDFSVAYLRAITHNL